MGLGPRDIIDELLVKKYASEQVNNLSDIKLVEAEKMMGVITDYANMSRNMLALNSKLQQVCAQVNTKAVKYRNTRNFANV